MLVDKSLKQKKVQILLLILLLPLQALGAITNLSPYQAKYSIYWRGIKAGETTQTLEANNKNSARYSFSSETTSNIPFLKYKHYAKSNFIFEENKITPLTHEFKQQKFSKISQGKMDFEWDKAVVHSSVDEEQLALPLEQGMQDTLTHALTLQLELINNQKQDQLYQVINGTTIRQYKLSIIGQENIKTPLGNLKTLIIESQSTHSPNKKTLLWVSPEHSYTPVQFAQIRKGKTTISGKIKNYKLTSG